MAPWLAFGMTNGQLTLPWLRISPISSQSLQEMVFGSAILGIKIQPLGIISFEDRTGGTIKIVES